MRLLYLRTHVAFCATHLLQCSDVPRLSNFLLHPAHETYDQPFRRSTPTTRALQRKSASCVCLEVRTVSIGIYLFVCSKLNVL